MLVTLGDIVKGGYVASIYCDDRKENYYWLEVSYEEERVLFAIKVRDQKQLDELLRLFQKIKTNTLEKLLDLKKVKGFSAGRLIRYIKAGKRMDLFFGLFYGTFVATIALTTLFAFIYDKSNKISLLAVMGMVGIAFTILFYILYRIYRGRLKYDK